MFIVHAHRRGKLGVGVGILACLSIFLCTATVKAATVTSAPWTTLSNSSALVLPLAPRVEVTPNDPDWIRQWDLRQIGAPEAWSVTTGTKSVIVAVIDGGVDINHPDLKANIWTNPKEVESDQIDNDQNGYTDDLHGWNFITSNPDVRPLSKNLQREDAWSHGTMIASLIAAKGNDGVGMAGVAWNVKIMPLVVLDADGAGTTVTIIQAIRYAVNKGASVINLSLAGYEDDPALRDMIKRAADAGVVIVAATGNDDKNKEGINLDKNPAYPACDDVGIDAVIGVGGTDALDQRAPYANFGTRCTDLSAPGHQLFAARPSYPHDPSRPKQNVSNYRAGIIGTSLAAPLVSGAAALLKSVHPTWTRLEIQARLYATADSLDPTIATGSRGLLGYGRLNIGRALRPDPVPVVSVAVTSSKPQITLAAPRKK